jgi:hypothetical protein
MSPAVRLRHRYVTSGLWQNISTAWFLLHRVHQRSEGRKRNLNTYLLRGATVLVRTLAASYSTWGFVTANVYGVGSSAPHLTPNLQDQGISLILAPPSKPVRHRWPYQQLCCSRHSFRVHRCTQAPAPSNKCLNLNVVKIQKANGDSFTAVKTSNLI